MKFHPTPFSGLVLIETTAHTDNRGSFQRLFCDDEFAQLRPDLRWLQINLSRTREKGAVRGMHYQQPPLTEAKLIRCLRGRVFDVAVDIRADSPTFLQWHGVELDELEPRMLFIPEGFAHGFQALTPDVELLYLHTARWSREYERRLHYEDPRLAIIWPLPVTQISEQDRAAPLIDTNFHGVVL